MTHHVSLGLLGLRPQMATPHGAVSFASKVDAGCNGMMGPLPMSTAEDAWTVGDHLTMARYIMLRGTEKHDYI